jgi:hypothetical protein
MSARLIDLTNKQFGQLKVLRKASSRNPSNHDTLWLCECSCGNLHVTGSCNLRSGRSKSCGCKKNLHGEANPAYRHGMTSSPEHAAYRSARSRCTNPNVACYKEYGGRGITFNFDSFEEWYAELGPRPTPEHSVNRIDNEGPYEPGNVKWATKAEQVANRRKFQTLSKYTDPEIFAELRRRGYDIGE